MVRLAVIAIDDRIMDLIANISWYSGRVTDIVPEIIVESITNVISNRSRYYFTTKNTKSHEEYQITQISHKKSPEGNDQQIDQM